MVGVSSEMILMLNTLALRPPRKLGLRHWRFTDPELVWNPDAVSRLLRGEIPSCAHAELSLLNQAERHFDFGPRPDQMPRPVAGHCTLRRQNTPRRAFSSRRWIS